VGAQALLEQMLAQPPAAEVHATMNLPHQLCTGGMPARPARGESINLHVSVGPVPLLNLLCCPAALLHRWYNLIARMASNPTWTCGGAYSAQDYNTFIGDPTNDVDIGTWSTTYYNTTAPTKWAWINIGLCTASYTG
jgi:hypothetical protein